MSEEEVFRSTSEYLKKYFPNYYAKNVLKKTESELTPEKSLLEPIKSKLKKPK